ncbi:hypothetical protein GGS24DRAFT_496600 [Hypoxylon argillaceum]|nr:hypothetical protein GGS24DRAFT_496600 [Hypoxylon argillaceum]KAI1155546.1 hypothetical protein F4825DRAFT_407292 [Nemania diffusa]
MFSSISRFVGSAGQANYAAGNLFMDGLAHYCDALGERATSLVLGVIMDHDALATDQALRNRILAQKFLAGVSSAKLLALPDHYCHAEDLVSESSKTQIAIRLSPVSQIKATSLQSPRSFLSLPFYKHIFNFTLAANDNDVREETGICVCQNYT